jgi:hypothetical protein
MNLHSLTVIARYPDRDGVGLELDELARIGVRKLKRLVEHLPMVRNKKQGPHLLLSDLLTASLNTVTYLSVLYPTQPSHTLSILSHTFPNLISLTLHISFAETVHDDPIPSNTGPFPKLLVDFLTRHGTIEELRLPWLSALINSTADADKPDPILSVAVKQLPGLLSKLKVPGVSAASSRIADLVGYLDVVDHVGKLAPHVALTA